MSASSPASRQSRDCLVNLFTPVTLPAHKLSAGLRNVYPLWEAMTPIACKTAFLESRPNTAGWLIHSNDDSSSVSRALKVIASIPEADELPISDDGDDCRSGRSSVVSPP